MRVMNECVLSQYSAICNSPNLSLSSGWPWAQKGYGVSAFISCSWFGDSIPPGLCEGLRSLGFSVIKILPSFLFLSASASGVNIRVTEQAKLWKYCHSLSFQES